MKTKLFGILFMFCSLCHAQEKREILLELQVPDTSWSLRIQEVVEVGEELWVLSRLTQAEGMMGAMVITTLRDRVSVEAGEPPVKHYVLGKTWNWENEEDVTFLKDRSRIAKELDGGKRLYPQE